MAANPMLPPISEDEFEEMLADAHARGPMPAPVADVAPEPSPVPAEERPQAPAARVAPMLPAIPIPERRSARTGSRGGRAAHAAIGGLLGALTGGRHDAGYSARLRGEAAASEQDYKDQQARYKYAVEARKRQKDLLPIPAELARAAGLPEGTTYGDARDIGQQLNTSANYRQGVGIAAAKDAAEAAAKVKAGAAEQANTWEKERDARLQTGAIDQIKEKNKGRRGRGGGHGMPRSQVDLVSQVLGESTEYAQKGMDDLWAGRDTTEARKVAQVGSGNKRLKPMIATLIAHGAKQTTIVERHRDALRKDAKAGAALRRDIRVWNEWDKNHTDKQIAQYVADMKSGGGGSAGSREMMRSLQGPVASFVFSLGGAALSEQEAALILGPAGAAFLKPLVTLEGLGVRDMMGAITTYIQKANVTAKDIRAIADKVRESQADRDAASARGVPDAALDAAAPEVRTPELRRRGKERLGDALRAGTVTAPPGATLRNVTTGTDGATTFEWVLPDGKVERGSL